MNYEINNLIGPLPRLDAPAETVTRVRRQAHLLLGRRRTLAGRVYVELSRIYNLLLEPVLLAGTGAVSLAWAVSRIRYITG